MSYGMVCPTLVYGEGDVLIHNIAWVLRYFPIFAIPGDGAYRLQPPLWSATGSALPVDVVEQHVITQPVGAGKESTAAVHPGHLLDERHQVVVVVEHEGVDHDVLAGTALHLEQGLLQGLRQRRIQEYRPLALHLRRPLALGDADHLLVPRLVPVKELAGQP